MITTATTTSAPIGARAQGGPPLWVLALAYVALMVAGVAVSAGVPLPSAPAEAVLTYQRGHAGALRLAAFLQFGSAMPLAIWAATSYRRLRVLGVTAPGTAIGFAGGLLAAGSLALGGLVGWTRAETADVADPALAKLLAQLSFAAGGVGYAVPFALLVAGVSVPALILPLLPRALGWAGMALAVVGVLATGALLTPALDPALPVTRFGGALWLLAVGFLLPRTRPRRQPRL
ncbi:DUF4386 domain-containing protein [Gandjariella thermophila]|uniref:DUF4386 domain-containing protein n=1 Tax=Gandjariella thermophila TaxID=1931992 RepID=A0A4D4J231_9PSEU|nr:DUF4386 domain-containing protein [Gandjariella thermophila]GDY28838.1 hypothetical protein GTS_04710 [Gandjariella thermophila]